MTRIHDAHLKQFIVDSGLVPRKELVRAEEEAEKDGLPLSDVLVAHGALTEDDIRRIEAYILGIPFISLKGYSIDVAVLGLIPEPIARNHNIVACKRYDDILEVALLDINDLAKIDFLKQTHKLKISPRFTDTSSMKHALRQYQKILKSEFGDIIMRESALLGDEESYEGIAEEVLKERSNNSPAVRIVDTLLRHALVQGASDIHLEPQERGLLVRYRIDGALHDAMTLPARTSATLSARIKVLARLKLAEIKVPQDGRFKMEMDGQRTSFQVSVLPVFSGEKIVMRVFPEGSTGRSLEEIGFHGEGLERIYEATKKKQGFMLVSGEKGSGKTTTAYAFLDLINTPETNISTVEGKIMRRIPRVNQTQIDESNGYTYEQGIRSLMRQDADVVMIGEVESETVAHLGIHATLAGRFALSTIESSSASRALIQLIEVGVEPFLIVSSVGTVVGQQLVERLGASNDSYTLSETERADLEQHIDIEKVLHTLKEERKVPQDATWHDVLFYRPEESAACPTGYTGKVGVNEVLVVSGAVKEIIMRGGTAEAIEKQAQTEGMLTIAEDALYKAALGLTSLEEVFKVARDRK